MEGRIENRNILLGIVLILLVLVTMLYSKKRTESIVETHELEKIEVNQVETYLNNYGEYGQSPAHTSGTWWPKGSGNGYVFGAGLWIAGVQGTDSVVVNGYNTVGFGDEFMPGPWQHNQDHLSNPTSHPEDRLYVSTDSLDFLEWPLVDTAGAKIIWGDQDTWCLFNSHEETRQTEPPYITIPVTVTRHTSAWPREFLENVFFFEYIFQNTDTTGTDSIFNMYVGIGCDHDVGYADNDLVGLDRPSGVGFTSTLTQESGWDALPPYYIGYKIIQGPRADDSVRIGQDPQNPDTIILPGERIPLSSFQGFTRNNDANNDRERYLAMAGFEFDTIPPIYNPFGDSIDADPDDKRFCISAGPFDLAPGEVDTVIIMMLFSNGNTGGLQNLIHTSRVAEKYYNNLRK
jgi:hypothetical protein